MVILSAHFLLYIYLSETFLRSPFASFASVFQRKIISPVINNVREIDSHLKTLLKLLSSISTSTRCIFIEWRNVKKITGNLLTWVRANSHKEAEFSDSTLLTNCFSSIQLDKYIFIKWTTNDTYFTKRNRKTSFNISMYSVDTSLCTMSYYVV